MQNPQLPTPPQIYTVRRFTFRRSSPRLPYVTAQLIYAGTNQPVAEFVVAPTADWVAQVLNANPGLTAHLQQTFQVYTEAANSENDLRSTLKTGLEGIRTLFAGLPADQQPNANTQLDNLIKSLKH